MTYVEGMARSSPTILFDEKLRGKKEKKVDEDGKYVRLTAVTVDIPNIPINSGKPGLHGPLFMSSLNFSLSPSLISYRFFQAFLAFELKGSWAELFFLSGDEAELSVDDDIFFY